MRLRAPWANHQTPDSIYHLLDAPAYRTWAAYGNMRDSARLVLRDSTTWAELWERIVGPNSDPVPPVDFSKYMLIVAAMGAQATTGYVIRIDSLAVHEDELVASICTRRPNPRTGVFGTMTSPLDIVRVPRHTGSVRFVDQGDAVTCEPIGR